MNQRRALQPHEIRVIKIDRIAILELLWEILGDICCEKFCLPQNKWYKKKVCFDWIFDENQCEFILFAQCHAYKACTKSIAANLRNHSIDAIDSLLSKPNGGKYYYSIQNFSCNDPFSLPNNPMGVLIDNLDIQIRPLRKHEIRVIRLSRQAIQELLWEHFMETGDEAMEIPEETGEISTIYHMYVEGQLEKLTLYVMNFNEASEEVFVANQEYCKKNIGFTTNSYSKRAAKRPSYISVVPSKS